MRNAERRFYTQNSHNWLPAVKFTETRRKLRLVPTNGNLYHYGGNNPVKYTDPDGNMQNFAQKLFTKALSFMASHSEKLATFIRNHTNVAITRNVYEGKEIQERWDSWNYDKAEIYYQDNLSVEVFGIPLNNIQVQSTADHPSGIDDRIPSGTKGKADVGKSGATIPYIRDTLLFNDKGDFLHPPKPGLRKPGSEGCVVTENEADNREVMDILRKNLGIKNGNKQVNYSVKNSTWLRNIFRKGNLDE